MNVEQLKEALDDFGDHLPVVIAVEDDEGEIATYYYVSLGSGQVGGDICVILAPGTQKKND